MLPAWCVLRVLTWKCASRHNAVHFFDILTSKSFPSIRCFVHFDFEMCFAPRMVVCGHFNFPSMRCLVHFDFEMCLLCATTACNFSSLISPDGSAPAALASLLFDPPEPQNIILFARLHLLSSDSFSSLSFFLLLFSSLTLPTSAFSSVHIVGSLTSKLSSIISKGF